MLDTPWKAEIQYGPEGEAYYAWVYTKGRDLVGTFKTHHAFDVVKAVNSHGDLLELAKLVQGSFGGGRVVTFSDEDMAAFEAAIAKAEGN